MFSIRGSVVLYPAPVLCFLPESAGNVGDSGMMN